MRCSRQIIALTMASALTLAACNDGSGPNESVPPALPSVASMDADLGLFTTEGSALQAVSPTPGSNFVAAALSVTVARLWTGAVLAVPVATWAAATSATPVFHDGAFHWEYSVTENGQTVGAHLTGRGDGDESVWEMRVTSTALGLDDYLWYTGRALLSGESGEWHIFDAANPDTRSEVLAIDWTHSPANAWTLQFTNMKTGAVEAGDRLRYESNGEQRLVSFTDASAQTTAEITWNATTRSGSIHAPGFNGGLKSCWDSALQNVACP